MIYPKNKKISFACSCEQSFTFRRGKNKTVLTVSYAVSLTFTFTVISLSFISLSNQEHLLISLQIFLKVTADGNATNRKCFQGRNHRQPLVKPRKTHTRDLHSEPFHFASNSLMPSDKKSLQQMSRASLCGLNRVAADVEAAKGDAGLAA